MRTPRFQKAAPVMSKSGWRKTVRHKRAINQMAVPMPAIEAQP